MNKELESRELTSRPSEARLLEIREQAASLHAAPGALISSSERINTSYYGLPVLKPPQWKWEVPVYLFVGGMGGAAAAIAGAGSLRAPNSALVREARRLAALCGVVSPVLLIADLGKPSRFLAMLRVFKPQSPMSVGSWTLMAFSGSAAMASLTGAHSREANVLQLIRWASQTLSFATGLVLATYTGVLVGATAIPVWAENSALLPFHFGVSGLASAVSVLQLAGHEDSIALHRLGIATAAAETAVGGCIELKKTPAMRPLKKGPSGWMTRLGGILSGPLPLALRLLAGTRHSRRSVNLRRVAAASSIAGSMVTRFAWIRAGHTSAADPAQVLLPPSRDGEACEPAQIGARGSQESGSHDEGGALVRQSRPVSGNSGTEIGEPHSSK